MTDNNKSVFIMKVSKIVLQYIHYLTNSQHKLNCLIPIQEVIYFTIYVLKCQLDFGSNSPALFLL